MTHYETSKALALAIGYLPKDMAMSCEVLRVRHHQDQYTWWRPFDYRDPAVIWPIAERYGVFPHPLVDGDFATHKRRGSPTITGWEVFVCDLPRSTELNAKWLHYYADTAAKTVVLAVIGAASAQALSQV